MAGKAPCNGIIRDQGTGRSKGSELPVSVSDRGRIVLPAVPHLFHDDVAKHGAALPVLIPVLNSDDSRAVRKSFSGLQCLDACFLNVLVTDLSAVVRRAVVNKSVQAGRK